MCLLGLLVPCTTIVFYLLFYSSCSCSSCCRCLVATVAVVVMGDGDPRNGRWAPKGAASIPPDAFELHRGGERMIVTRVMDWVLIESMYLWYVYLHLA